MFDPTTATLEEEPQSSTLPLDFVKKLEGWNPQAYGDYKQTSIGFGTRARFPGEVIDETEGERRLASELTEHARRVDEAAQRYGVNLTPFQRDALISFDFNTGQGPAVMESREPGAIAERMSLYNKVTEGGRKVVNKGLVNRRKAEIQHFMQPVAQGDIEERPAQSINAGFDPSTAEEEPAPIAQPTPRGLAHVQNYAMQNSADALAPFEKAASLDWSDIRKGRDAETLAKAESLRAQADLAVEQGSGTGPGSEAFNLRRQADEMLAQLSDTAQRERGEVEMQEIADASLTEEREQVPPWAIPAGAGLRGLTDNAGGAVGGALTAAAFVPGGQIPALAGGFLGAMTGSSAQEAVQRAVESDEETIARLSESAETAQNNPTAYAVGQTLASAPFFRPSVKEISKALSGEVNASKNVAAAMGIGTGATAAGQAIQGQEIDPATALRGGLENVIMSKPTRLGRAIGFDPVSAKSEPEPLTSDEMQGKKVTLPLRKLDGTTQEVTLPAEKAFKWANGRLDTLRALRLCLDS